MCVFLIVIKTKIKLTIKQKILIFLGLNKCDHVVNGFCEIPPLVFDVCFFCIRWDEFDLTRNIQTSLLTKDKLRNVLMVWTAE